MLAHLIHKRIGRYFMGSEVEENWKIKAEPYLSIIIPELLLSGKNVKFLGEFLGKKIQVRKKL